METQEDTQGLNNAGLIRRQVIMLLLLQSSLTLLPRRPHTGPGGVQDEHLLT